MNCARNYENVLNFVKVMPKILLVPFYRTRCIICVYKVYAVFLYSVALCPMAQPLIWFTSFSHLCA